MPCTSRCEVSSGALALISLIPSKTDDGPIQFRLYRSVCSILVYNVFPSGIVEKAFAWSTDRSRANAEARLGSGPVGSLTLFFLNIMLVRIIEDRHVELLTHAM